MTDTDTGNVESARAAALSRLAQHAVGGGVTLDEYAEQVAAIERAANAEDIQAAVGALPEGAGTPAPVHPTRWLVGVLGGTKQEGRWRLSRRLGIVAVLGGASLDLGRAEPEALESVVTIVAFFGGVEIIAPPGVPIEFTGLSLLGGKSDERGGGPLLPGSPLVRLRVFAVLGGVKVKKRSTSPGPFQEIRSRFARRTGA